MFAELLTARTWLEEVLLNRHSCLEGHARFLVNQLACELRWGNQLPALPPSIGRGWGENWGPEKDGTVRKARSSFPAIKFR